MGRTKGSKNGCRKVPLKKPKIKYEEHLETFNENLDLMEPSLPIFETSVLNAYRSKKYGMCIELIEKILMNNTDENKDHYKILQAASHTMLGKNFEISHSILDDVLLTDPSSSFAMYGKGVAFYFEEKFDKSIEMFDRAIEANPDEQMRRAKDMKIRIDLEQRKAIIRIEKIHQNPQEESCLSDSEVPEEIESLMEEFDLATDEDPLNNFELVNGKKDDDLTSLKVGAVHFTKHHKFSSSQTSYNGNEGIKNEEPIEMSQEKKSISESSQPCILDDIVEDSVKHEPSSSLSKPVKSAEELFAQGMTLYKSGLLKKSLRIFKKAFKTNPNMMEADEMGTKAQELLELMDVSAVNMLQKNYEVVVEIMNEALDIDESNDYVNRPFYFQRGLAYFHLGNNEESMKDYAKFDRINKLLTQK